ncbi:MAG: hypothetical protein ABIQ30_07135 [Devosia sp.]
MLPGLSKGLDITAAERNLNNKSTGAARQLRFVTVPKLNRFRNIAFVAGFFAVGLIYGFAAWSLLERHNYAATRIEQDSIKDRDRRDYSILNCTGETAIATFVCDLNAYASEREAKRSQDDLQAQQDSANGAFWMFVIGGLQALLGVGGIWFVARTLDANAAAVDAANRAVEATITASEAQVRAYLSVERVYAAIGFPNGDPDYCLLQVEVHVVNGGQTPARQMDTRAVLATAKRAGKRTGRFKTTPEHADLLPGTPRKVLHVEYRLTAEDITALEDPKSAIFTLRGNVWYKPVVGKKRKIRSFSYNLFPPEEGLQQNSHLSVIRTERGNDGN